MERIITEGEARLYRLGDNESLVACSYVQMSYDTYIGMAVFSTGEIVLTEKRFSKTTSGHQNRFLARAREHFSLFFPGVEPVVRYVSHKELVSLVTAKIAAEAALKE